MGVVYMATCKSTGMSYVGKTTRTLAKRMIQHKSQTKKSNLYFHNAIKKYGWDNFDWQVLWKSDDEAELLREEIESISVFNTMYPHGYNLTLGGEGLSGVIFPESWHQYRKKWAVDNFGKPVYCLETDSVYGTIVEAAIQLNMAFGTISGIANRADHRSLSKHFCFANEDDIQELKRMAGTGELYVHPSTAHYGEANHSSRRVRNRDDGRVFSMIREAVAFYGFTRSTATAICMCCTHKRKTAGGFHWEYAD